jgi:uncharacterized protein YdaU (DUF1376 family)
MSKKSRPLFIDWCAEDALKGTEILEPLEELAYRRIIDLIYATNDELLDDEKRLSRMTKTGKKWKSIRENLISLRKISIENGKIRNEKCSNELIAARSRIEQSSHAGKISAEKRKALKNKETYSTDVDAPLLHPYQPTTTHHPLPTNNPNNKHLNSSSARVPEPSDQGVGVFENGNGGVSAKPTRPVPVPTTPQAPAPATSRVFKIEHKLTDDGLKAAKAAAPGWDLYHLMRIYDEGIASGKREAPRSPDKAFAAWCALYTKGKQP